MFLLYSKRNQQIVSFPHTGTNFLLSIETSFPPVQKPTRDGKKVSR